jgi:hypothetical protein
VHPDRTIHPDRLQHLSSTPPNGFISTPPRGPSGGGSRHPSTYSRGGGGFGPHSRGMPPQQPASQRPVPPVQPRIVHPQPPIGPRRGSTTNGPSTATSAATPPPTAIPTGPRAGNFPYRTSLPTQAPARYTPAIQGPGALITGGRLLPPIDRASEDRLARLKLEQIKLEEEVRISQEKKRKGMYAWEKTRREAKIAHFRAEVADRQLMSLE